MAKLAETVKVAATCMTLVPAGLRARVWIKAWHFFSRESAQGYCWLWLLDGDGRVHALRMEAACHGRDDLLPALIARLAVAPDASFRAEPALGHVQVLPQAPIVPLTRWAVSWGHPVQGTIRAFAAELDTEVLTALGRLEVAGPFFGSVENYNRLALLPQPARLHRLQALAEFPPLVAPLLLDLAERPDMFGGYVHEPSHRGNHAAASDAPVLEAVDRGRDLIGALARHYRIGRALVRSPLFRTPTAEGFVRRERLRLLDAIPAHRRPREHAELESWLPCLDALPIGPRSPRDVERLAGVFARGWQEVWQSLATRFQPLEPALRDTRDFLRAALGEAELPPALARLDAETLGLAWLCRRGPRSLLETSRRWHAQAIVERSGPEYGLPAAVTPILGEPAAAEGRARELSTPMALVAEGETMHHCVGDYWAHCALDATRIFHLETTNGETATAQYNCGGNEEHPRFGLAALRGPCNREPSAGMRRFAARIEKVMNEPQRRENRVRALRESREAKADYERTTQETLKRRADRQPGGGLRPLDRRSRQESRRVLAWCLEQEDWHFRPDELFRGPVAGFGYAEGPQLLDRMETGDRLCLAREPANPHDSLAVRVDWSGHKLGYLPRPDNAPVARLLDAGTALAATIVAVRPVDEPWTQLEIAVTPENA